TDWHVRKLAPGGALGRGCGQNAQPRSRPSRAWIPPRVAGQTSARAQTSSEPPADRAYRSELEAPSRRPKRNCHENPAFTPAATATRRSSGKPEKNVSATVRLPPAHTP